MSLVAFNAVCWPLQGNIPSSSESKYYFGFKGCVYDVFINDALSGCMVVKKALCFCLQTLKGFS